MPMDLLRKYLWLWVIVGMIFVSVVISLIFLLINKCISRQGKHKISQLLNRSSFNSNSNKYQERTFSDVTPDLPPRTQFLTAEAQSYENLAEAPNCERNIPDYEESYDDYEESIHDYEESTPDYVQTVPDYEESTPDYVQTVPDYEQSTPDYEQSTPDYEQSTSDYEQSTPDYEQSMPDYIKVEDEQHILPPPPPPPPNNYPDPMADDASTEDYDDIGGEDEILDEEDYDDVG